MADKPFSPACERNREPILDVLRQHLADACQVLEIGSGTGQHAAYFAAQQPHWTWQTSDRGDNLPGVRQWLDEAGLPNTPPPLEFDVNGIWPDVRFDAIFSANTLHIMAWDEVRALFAGLPTIARDNALLIIYGPFNDNGRYSSDSNAAFDQWLKARGTHMGIRDSQAVDALARAAGFSLREDMPMPANNRCRVWQRGAGVSP